MVYPDQLVTIGIDIGATKILIGSVTREGRIVHQKRYEIDISSADILKKGIYHSIEDYITDFRGTDTSKTVGIGIFGHVDSEQGLWMGSLRIPGMEPLCLVDDLKKAYGFDVVMDNDVHAATLAEMYLGKGRRYRNFLYVNIGTGIAAGMVTDGKLVRGAVNYAGEIGHMFVGRDMEPCMCGRNWCMETAASGGGMIHRACRWIEEYPDSVLADKVKSDTVISADIFNAARLGDKMAVRIYEDFIWSAGIGLVNLVNILNPEAIILGGGVLKDQWLLKELSAFVYKNAIEISGAALKEVSISELGPQVVGLLGAACLTWYRQGML